MLKNKLKSKLRLFYILSLCFCLKIQAQNIIPDYSFESDTACPFQPGQVYLLNSGWFEYWSVDYFNSCDTSNSYGVPINRIGFQNTHSGNGYVVLYGYYSTVFSREYIEAPLSITLQAGHKYYVSFYVSLGDTMQYAIENLGAMFTDTIFDPYPAPSYNWHTGTPQVENPAGNILNDKINWTEIAGNFIAVGGEKYITIGNFKNDAQTVKQNLGGTGSNNYGAYYYIDDVYVSDVPLGISNELRIISDELKVFLNPGNGVFAITSTAKTPGNLIVTNILGEIIYETKFFNNEQQIDLSHCAKGLYNVRFGAAVKRIVIQ